jgi:prepilin-type processing-associated H-X9-DG protein
MRRTHPLEIIVVLIGIIILAVGLLLPVIEGPREPDRRMSCLSNAKQLGLAIKQYSQDYMESYPWRTGQTSPEEAWLDLGMLFPNYISSWRCFHCPVSQDRPFIPQCAFGDKGAHPLEPLVSSDSRDAISYAYGIDARDPARRTAWTEDALSSTRLLADKKAGARLTAQSNHKLDGRNVLYNDGHVKWKAGDGPLDPDEDDDAIGAPGAPDCTDWWSDPPYYGEEP